MTDDDAMPTHLPDLGMRQTYPPNIDKIAAVLPAAKTSKIVIFTYDKTIWNPHRINVTPYLRTHEEVHALRQGEDSDAWWDRYLADLVFRKEEELLAYASECAHYAAEHGRPERRKYLHQAAKRISDPLYGGAITFSVAHSILKGAERKSRP